MTEPGLDYFYVPELKPVSPRWHRLPSSWWLGAALFICAAFAIGVTFTDHALILVVPAFIAGVGVIVASILEIYRYRRTVGSVVNLCVEIATNPYIVLGVLVNVGVLDFG